VLECIVEKVEAELRARKGKDGSKKDCYELRKSILLVPLPANLDVHTVHGD
jgi:hypothetical protein